MSTLAAPIPYIVLLIPSDPGQTAVAGWTETAAGAADTCAAWGAGHHVAETALGLRIGRALAARRAVRS